MSAIHLPREAVFSIEELAPALGDGLALSTDVFLRHEDQEWQPRLHRTVAAADGEQAFSDIRVRAIPYYAWANRESGAMRVWLPHVD